MNLLSTRNSIDSEADITVMHRVKHDQATGTITLIRVSNVQDT